MSDFPETEKMEPNTEFLSYENVGVSASTLWQSDRKRVVFRIQRDKEQAGELRYGSPEERPLGALLLGLVLMLPGYFPARHVFYYFNHRGTDPHLVGLRYEAALLLFAGVGLWLVYGSLFKRNYYLRVITSNGTKKLVFSSKATPAGIAKFLSEAQARFGLRHTDLTQDKPERV